MNQLPENRKFNPDAVNAMAVSNPLVICVALPGYPLVGNHFINEVISNSFRCIRIDDNLEQEATS